MAQVTVSASSFTALNKADRASRSLTHNAFASPLLVSLPNVGKRDNRYPSIVIVSRVADTTTSTTTTVTPNGSVISDKTTIQGTKSAVIMPPSVTEFSFVGAAVTVTRKQSLSRAEQVMNGVDVITDLTGSRMFLQLVSEDPDPGTGVGRRTQETFIKDSAEKATALVAGKVQYTAETLI